MIYLALAQRILGSQRYPIVLVDWSDIDHAKRHFLLRASIPLDGQCVTLYEEVHTVRSKEKRETHRLFIRRLSALLPPGFTPMMVTDAGFRTPVPAGGGPGLGVGGTGQKPHLPPRRQGGRLASVQIDL